MTGNSRTDMREMRERIGTWGHLNQERLNSIKQFAGKTLLDVGCSTGSYVKYLNGNELCKAYGTDLIDDPQWASNKNWFLEGNISNLPFTDNAFETLTAFEVIEHIPNFAGALQEMHRVCKKNIIISVPNCEYSNAFKYAGLSFHHEIDPTHCNRFTKAVLNGVLKDIGFVNINIFTINPIQPIILLLDSFALPLTLSRAISKMWNYIPFGRTYKMTLLAVAEK